MTDWILEKWGGIRHDSPGMISLEDLNRLPETEFISILSEIYEHSEWVPAAVVSQRPFANVGELRQCMEQAVESSSPVAKMQLIVSHPDLAGKLAKAGMLTDFSLREQAGLGLDRLSDEEYQRFSKSNRAYRQKFGIPFIICARLTTKAGVLEAFQKRQDNTVTEELAEAVLQIHLIAKHRLDDLVVR